jgi:hypothetical protein
MSRDRTGSTPAASRREKPRGGLASASAAMAQAASEHISDVAPPAGKAKSATPKAATRVGKKGLVLYVHPEVSLELRRLAIDTGSDVQRLGLRALELLFAEHGRSMPELAAPRVGSARGRA